MNTAANLFLSGMLVLLSAFYGKPFFAQTFQAHLVDTLAHGYKVEVADLNNDGKPDIIGLATTPASLVWYENPTWEKHVITTRTMGNIDFAIHDIDSDGKMDLALASGFEMRETMKGGLLHWLRNPGVSSREWQIYPIGAEPTSHRLLWMDFHGDGRKELVNAPVMGRGATEPEWKGGVRLQWYEIPNPPEKGQWRSNLIDNQLTVLHGICVVDWDSDGREDLLTASFEGVHLFLSKKSGDKIIWNKRRLAVGQEAAAPARGSSEIAIGNIKPSGRRFLATIEPWHGDKVVVYASDNEDEVPWKRSIIDRTYSQGHALITADLDEDGTDEIIAGYRGEGASLYFYRCADEAATQWNRIPLDEGGMATSGIVTADINGDGKLDIIAIGTATNTIKWYENLK